MRIFRREASPADSKIVGSRFVRRRERALEIDILPQSGKRLGNIASFGRVRSRHVALLESTFLEEVQELQRKA